MFHTPDPRFDVPTPSRGDGVARPSEAPVRQLRGFTLVEMVIVVAMLAVFVLLAAVQFDGWREVESARSGARTVAAAFEFARSEAVRTGHNHLLFFEEDTAGAALTDADGATVPILILDDGLPGAANQNCQIDGGEPIQALRLEGDVAFGTTAATAAVPIDEGTGTYTSGSSFVDASGNDATWVMFRSDGTPRAVDGSCAVDALGSGGGGIYLSNAERDVAVVLTPLGASRVLTWNTGASQWQ